MKYTANELAARISEGGRKGAAHTASIRRSKRERYLAGQMDEAERQEYENYVQQRRAAGSKGGNTTSARRRQTTTILDGQGVS